MEWVETTAKTLDEAREAALDQLGVGADEAEFDIVEEPKPGLFGRTRGQARLRARVKPAPVRPKQERRRRSKSDKSKSDATTSDSPATDAPDADAAMPDTDAAEPAQRREDTAESSSGGKRSRSTRGRESQSRGSTSTKQEKNMSNDERPPSDVSPQEVGDAAVAFMDDLVAAFGATGSAELTIDGTELDVQVTGEDLGLLVGPGGRTLNAVQDLVRVAAQRRLGDHETRLRIDVAGYRERRTAALAKFAADVAAQVRESGTARSLEPMTSADRKVIHDALNDEDGVVSSSAGEDPNRRVIVEPA